MSDDTPDARLVDLAQRWADALDALADAQEAVKAIKLEAKDAGYDVKILGQAIKEMRGDPEYRAEVLLAELELDTYRRALDLPTEATTAQSAARAAAAGEAPRAGRYDA